MAIAAGTQLGPYEVLAPLGAGGMGEVYRARDTRVGREVAVKILPRDVAGDPARRRRFEREARLAATLNHPNVVGLFDLGPDHDPPYIVSELVAGESLRAVMSRGAIPLRKALDLGAQIAEGLAAAHAVGVVHRDIKPENVMVTPEGGVKILDLGLARVEEGRGSDTAGSATVTAVLETPGATSPGTVVGTVSYMSPEQASGQAVDYRSDQFSLGLVLYEMLARRRAFDRPTAAQTMAAIIQDEPPPQPAMVPMQVRWVVERCLTKEPAQRYGSTGDLARELGQLGRHASELTAGVSESEAGKRRRRATSLTLVAGSIGIAMVLGLGLGRLSIDDRGVDLERYRFKPFANLLKTSEWPSWSPDGKSIAFHGWVEAGAENQIWIQGVEAATPVQITHAPFVPIPGTLAWTPDSRMLYTTGTIGFIDSLRGIYRVPVAGGDPVLVQPDAMAGALSRDGLTLVMLAQESPSSQLRIWHASPPDAPRRLYEPVPFTAWGASMYPTMAFAPNGARLFASINGDSGPDCWVLPWPPGKAVRWRGLGGLLGSNGSPWMPDSRHVVGGLSMADMRTGRHWPILRGSTLGQTAVSPDGSSIAYVRSEGQTDVIEMPLAGGEPRTLVGTRASEAMPALSADGRELVYTSTARGAAEVWVMDMRDRSIRRLLASSDMPTESGSGWFLMNPILSRDRTRLAVEAIGGGQRRLYIAFTAGGTPVRATTQDEGWDERWPSWSPQGDRLAYIQDHGEEPRLMVVRPGSADRPLELLKGNLGAYPEWSPTGEWIAVGFGSQLILVSPDGHAKRELRSEGGPIAWAPDGRTLYVVHMDRGRGTVGAIDITTGVERKVRDLGDLIPDSILWPGLRISTTRDDKALVYAVGRGGGDIRLLEGVTTPKPWYARLWPW